MTLERSDRSSAFGVAFRPRETIALRRTETLTASCFSFSGVSSLSVQFAKLPKGLKHLNLSKTSLSPKGTVSLLYFTFLALDVSAALWCLKWNYC